MDLSVTHHIFAYNTLTDFTLAKPRHLFISAFHSISLSLHRSLHLPLFSLFTHHSFHSQFSLSLSVYLFSSQIQVSVYVSDILINPFYFMLNVIYNLPLFVHFSVYLQLFILLSSPMGGGRLTLSIVSPAPLPPSSRIA